MIKIILVRHGESVANKKGIYQGQTFDTGLTLRGEKQSLALAGRLQNLKVSVVYTSPLLRTRETAKIIAEQILMPVLLDNRIIEISHGKWEGKTKEWVEENYPELVRLWKEKPTRVQMPAGENLNQVRQRIIGFLAELVNKYNNQTIAIVGHDLIMRVIISLILRSPLNDIWDFRLDNGGITILEFNERMSGQIMVLNQNDHLNKYLSDIDSQAL